MDMLQNISDEVLKSELEKYQTVPVIDSKNRAILRKKLNHYKASENRKNGIIRPPTRRSTRKSVVSRNSISSEEKAVFLEPKVIPPRRRSSTSRKQNIETEFSDSDIDFQKKVDTSTITSDFESPPSTPLINCSPPAIKLRKRILSTSSNLYEHYISRLILFAFFVFLSTLAGYYFNIISVSNQNFLLLCNGRKECMEYYSKLAAFLHARSVSYYCSGDGSTDVNIKELPKHLNISLEKVNEVILKRLENAIEYFTMVDSNGEITSLLSACVALRLTAVSLPIRCRLRLAVLNFLPGLFIFLLSFVLVYSYYRYLINRRKERERHNQAVYRMVDRIIDVIRSQDEGHRTDSDIPVYIAIPHVRDMLLSPKERVAKKQVWNDAVKFISAHESRVRVESQCIKGEEFPAWSWIHRQPLVDGIKRTDPDRIRIWQCNTISFAGVSPKFIPSPCLKLRNMFDISREPKNSDSDWPTLIQDAILLKCADIQGILHIAVDRHSKEGCVYIRCDSPHTAGNVYKCIHGYWFDGLLITVKFITLEKYRIRFPDSDQFVEFLQPSRTNEKCLILNDCENDN